MVGSGGPEDGTKNEATVHCIGEDVPDAGLVVMTSNCCDGAKGQKFAVTVTELLGIENAHGLLVDPLLHEAPEIVQLENTYPEFGVAVTETL